MSEVTEVHEVQNTNYKKEFSTEEITAIIDNPKSLKNKIVRIVSTVGGLDTMIGLGIITEVDARPLTFLISVEPIKSEATLKASLEKEKIDIFEGIPVHAFIAKHTLLEGLLGIYEYNNFKIYLG